MARHASVAVAVLILGLALPAAAQAADLSGNWKLTVTADLPNAGGVCTFSGHVLLQQSGSSLSGTPVLTLSSGPAACPPLMVASFTGTVDNDGCVNGMLSSGPLGQAFLSACPDGKGGLAGEFGTETGPFAGTSGALTAVRPPNVVEVPVLDGLGLTLLATLLLVSGGWLLLKR